MKNKHKHTPIPRLVEYIMWFNNLPQVKIKFFRTCKERTPFQIKFV